MDDKYYIVVFNSNYIIFSFVGDSAIMTPTSGMLPLQPRPATTGSMDILPLQPKYLLNFDRKSHSEPREVLPSHDYSPLKTTETEIGLASVPAMAIGSSTEILVSIVENQAGFRRNSFMFNNNSKNDQKSPDFENVKSPSTEMTSSSIYSIESQLEKNDEPGYIAQQ